MVTTGPVPVEHLKYGLYRLRHIVSAKYTPDLKDLI